MQFFTSLYHGMTIGSSTAAASFVGASIFKLTTSNMKLHEASLCWSLGTNFLIVLRCFGLFGNNSSRVMAKCTVNRPEHFAFALFPSSAPCAKLLKTRNLQVFRARWPRPKGGRDRAKEVLSRLGDGFFKLIFSRYQLSSS
jgi:hypothetical protein